MDEENFSNWFITQLLPNIPDNAVIIMDNGHTTTCFLKMVSSIIEQKNAFFNNVARDNILFNEHFIRSTTIDSSSISSVKLCKLDHMLQPILCNKDRNIAFCVHLNIILSFNHRECCGVMKQYMAQHCDFTSQVFVRNLKRHGPRSRLTP